MRCARQASQVIVERLRFAESQDEVQAWDLNCFQEPPSVVSAGGCQREARACFSLPSNAGTRGRRRGFGAISMSEA